MNPSPDIHNFDELQQFMLEALRREHPEWVGADGAAPVLNDYAARLEKLLKMAVRPEMKAAADLGLAA